MKPFYIFIACLLALSSAIGQKHWEIRSSIPDEIKSSRSMMYVPKKYTFLSLDMDMLQSEIENPNFTLELPMPDRSFINFNFSKYEIMEEGLQVKYPGIKTFKGYNASSRATARIDVGPYGLHGSISTPEGTIYLDPATRESKEYYFSYYVKDNNEPTEEGFICGVSETAVHHSFERAEPVGSRSGNVELHKYRMALSCTGEWGAVRGTKEKALADMVTAVNRLNEIYESSMATRFVLIANNDLLIFLNPTTDPYPTTNLGTTLLGVANTTINTTLGTSNGHDIGHVFTTSCTDVGGVVSGQACTNSKGAGVTCQGGTNMISLAEGTFAHEVAHQMSASHTFSNCPGWEGQTPYGANFEPGSGTTIMSYAGACGDNNVGSRDAYFHNGSLVQMFNTHRYSSSPAYGCSVKEETSNTPPELTVDIINGITIPISTPFYLYGEGYDENGDVLMYNWEQKDSTLATPQLGMPVGDSPSFRSVRPGLSSVRFFPRKNALFSGVSEVTEVLPTYSRNFHFSLTARDINPEGSSPVWKFVDFKSDANSGPFKILQPNNSAVYEAGTKINVVWDVANTDKMPVNCNAVDIFLSVGSVLHESEGNFYQLASGVPNTGSAEIVIPEIFSSSARIVVRSVGNIFFDVSDRIFTIVESTKPTAYFNYEVSDFEQCLPLATSFNITTVPVGGYEGTMRFEQTEEIEGIHMVFSENVVEVGQSISAEISFDANLQSGTYTLGLRGITDGGDTLTRSIRYKVTSTDFHDLELISPQNTFKQASDQQKFTWSNSFNATQYTIQIAEDPLFENLFLELEVQDTFYTNLKAFDKSQLYFWRVFASNSCGESEESTDVYAFSTPFVDCKEFTAFDTPINISQSGRPEITSSLAVTESLIIDDINVKSVQINHDNMQDLTATIISPLGTEVILWSNQCPRRTSTSFTFDDESTRFFTCATNIVGSYKPQQALSAFDGQDAMGSWKLLIKDNEPGNGGRLEAFEIEFCGAVDVLNPFFVNFDTLEVRYKAGQFVDRIHLEATDEASNPEDLLYTIVSVPGQGYLDLSGVKLVKGNVFTQADINNNLLKYYNEGPENLPEGETSFDDFEVLVTNTLGGWEGVSKVIIAINSDFTSSVPESQLVEGTLKVFPNPANGMVEIEASFEMKSVTLYNLNGQIVDSYSGDHSKRIDVGNLPVGMYLVQVRGEKNILTTKLQVIK